MDKMTSREKKMLRDLQAKEKRIKRQNAQFWKDVDEKRDEVEQYLGMNREDKITEEQMALCSEFKRISGLYGISVAELLTYISSDRQVAYFKNYHKA